GRGDMDGARIQYRLALQSLDGYAPAQAGLGKIEAAEGRLDSAIALLRAAAEKLPLPEHVIALGDAYRAAGREAEAARQYRLVDAMDRIARENGVDSDMEMALFCADHGLHLEDALARARRAVAERPSIRAWD